LNCSKDIHKIAIIIPVHNRKEITLDCLDRLVPISRSNTLSTTIVVVDDGSTDGTTSAIKLKFKEVILLKGDGNLWWTGAINKGIEYVMDQGGFEYILIMNDDITFKKDFLSILLDTAIVNPDCIVGSTTLYAHNKKMIWKAGMIDHKGLHPLLHNNLQNNVYHNGIQEFIDVDAVSGRAMLIPVSFIQKNGTFDQKKFPHGFADHDFCLKIKKHKYRLLISSRSLIYSEPGSDKSFFHLLRKTPLPSMLKTFFNIKYDWHIKSLLAIYLNSRGKLRGFIGFFIHNCIFIKWMLLKLLLPYQSFQKKITSRIDD